jgi:hypothetical protein
MPNFVTLCPILVYLPAIIIVSVATVTGLTHAVIAWMGRRPAAASERQMRVGKLALKGSGAVGWDAFAHPIAARPDGTLQINA